MRDRMRKKEFSKWSRFFCFTVLAVSSFIIVYCVFMFPLSGRLNPQLVPLPQQTSVLELEAISGEWDSQPPQALAIHHTVTTPDQILVFLNYPPSSNLFTKDDIRCLYSSPNITGTSTPAQHHSLTPLFIDADPPERQLIVRCPLGPRGSSLALRLLTAGSNPGGHEYPVILPSLPGRSSYRWDFLAYEAMIDSVDNTTLVFVKGFRLKPSKLSDPTRFECVFGWDDINNPAARPDQFLLRSQVISIGQEVVRCRTPSSVLKNLDAAERYPLLMKVSVRLKGRSSALPSVAKPRLRPEFSPPDDRDLRHQLCVCTMLLNQARFLQEWIMYHARVGVERWFIYDNNSSDDIRQVIEWLTHREGYKVTRHSWPWIKSQEAGFAHCAMRARRHCEWIAFIDVDEFFHSPMGLVSLPDLLRNQSISSKEAENGTDIGEVRTFCYNFGPSGHKEIPEKGVMAGYTCRLMAHERHKSMVRPEALSPTLVNEVHHFQLREGYRYVTLDRPVMGINHYKYQTWEVFKKKFYRRVAAYVSDWQDEKNTRSKDRAPGLGTRAIEPRDWQKRFCEVNDTGLMVRAMGMFGDPETGILPWERMILLQYEG